MQINPSGGIPVAIVKVELYVHQFFTLLLFLFFPASLPLSLPYLPRPQLCNQFCRLLSLYFTLLVCLHLYFLAPFILAWLPASFISHFLASLHHVSLACILFSLSLYSCLLSLIIFLSLSLSIPSSYHLSSSSLSLYSFLLSLIVFLSLSLFLPPITYHLFLS